MTEISRWSLWRKRILQIPSCQEKETNVLVALVCSTCCAATAIWLMILTIIYNLSRRQEGISGGAHRWPNYCTEWLVCRNRAQCAGKNASESTCPFLTPRITLYDFATLLQTSLLPSCVYTKVTSAKSPYNPTVSHRLSCTYLTLILQLGLLLYLHDSGSRFLQNVDQFIPDYTS